MILLHRAMSSEAEVSGTIVRSLSGTPEHSSRRAQVAECSIVIMQTSAATDLNAHMIRRNIIGQRICFSDFLLTQADGIHSRTQVHSPDRLRAEFPDVEAKVRRLQVSPPARKEILQVPAIVRHVVGFEHIVLTLMPHEAFDSVLDTLLIQQSQ